MHDARGACSQADALFSLASFASLLKRQPRLASLDEDAKSGDFKLMSRVCLGLSRILCKRFSAANWLIVCPRRSVRARISYRSVRADSLAPFFLPKNPPDLIGSHLIRLHAWR